MGDTESQKVTGGGASPTEKPQAQAISSSSIYKQSDAEDRKKRRYKKLSKAYVWVEASCAIALVIITWLYTHYAHQQATAAHETLVEIQKQFPEIQTSADAATKANIAAHDALTRSNRPWVGVESFRIIVPISFIKASSGKDITYFVNGSLEITIKNFGSSPALSVSNFIEAYDPTYFSKEKFDPSDPFAQLRKFGDSVCTLADGNEFTKKNPRMYGGSVFPTQATTYTTHGIAGFSKRNIEVGQFMQLLGCISYRDQFGEVTHHTHYCVVAPIGVIAAVNNCESNTDAD